eukprot:15345497-Ditylum_brightwellii.AAC.1
MTSHRNSPGAKEKGPRSHGKDSPNCHANRHLQAVQHQASTPFFRVRYLCCKLPGKVRLTTMHQAPQGGYGCQSRARHQNAQTGYQTPQAAAHPSCLRLATCPKQSPNQPCHIVQHPIQDQCRPNNNL